MISFVVPAHNEELWIAACVRSLIESARSVGVSAEVIVVDDASTDRTGEIARSLGASVIRVDKRKIAAVRNAGALEATGEILVFVDGDTSITPELLRGAMEAIGKGAVGGGSGINFDGPVPFYARVSLEVVLLLFRIFRLTGGCFFFCTRKAFDAVGGFNEELYASEEVEMANKLKGVGRFVILRQRALTSGRKLRTHSFLEILGVLVGQAIKGRRSCRERDGLDIWYGDRRQDEHDAEADRAQARRAEV